MKGLLISCFLSLAAGHATASDVCRHALALGLDVSGSVDAREYRLQLDGLALALGSDAVRATLLERIETPVEILVYEWSGPKDQLTLVPWSRISDSNALEAVITQLKTVERRATSTPGTALGVAMMRGAQHLAQRNHCWRKTLDISGDGKSNLGPRPRDVKQRLAKSGITINALVIGADDPTSKDLQQRKTTELNTYFKTEVILGPDSFTETTLNFESYATAMQTKLLRELDGFVLSAHKN